MAYILVRQATSLLQRTALNVTIACQAWHAKNARHMLLGEPFSRLAALCVTFAHTSTRPYTDIVDYVEPVMLIVGSRGLGNLKG